LWHKENLLPKEQVFERCFPLMVEISGIEPLTS